MIRIKIDGKVVFKGEVGEWISTPPDQFRNAIKPGVRPEPHLKAIMVVLADAVVLGGNMRISVVTQTRGFEMKVENT